ncbi:MAG: maleylpyruvate isomerase family mycothiol-dependent enzyme [Propionibacteriaceae bacterium]|nr:maleylpyruvate isomerase family mycothiol-dependent enzyme [Propionibacteriaceae bacterium]
MTTTQPAFLDSVGGPIDEVCRQVLAATGHLLGHTIGFSEEDWSLDSRLPGWSRAHVAAHLAENAVGLRRLILGVIRGREAAMYDSPEARDAAIQLGAARDSLSLQIALDTSAGLLATALHDLPPAMRDEPVRLASGIRVPARLIPLIRLSELILHHCDLDSGFTLGEADTTPVLWCLELRAAMLRGRRDYPALRLIASEGLDVTTGRDGRQDLVRSDARTLLAWLTGRGPAPEGVRLPPLPIF